MLSPGMLCLARVLSRACYDQNTRLVHTNRCLPPSLNNQNKKMNLSRSKRSCRMSLESNHSIEDLLSFFECKSSHHESKLSRSGRNKSSRYQTSPPQTLGMEADERALGVRSCHPDRFDVDVREKIKLFEKGDSSRSVRKTKKRSSSDLNSLTLHNMVLRNSILFETWKHSGHKTSLEGPKAKLDRRKAMLRRAHGEMEKLFFQVCLHKINEPSNKPTQFSVVSHSSNSSMSSPTSPIHHERRSSTGCVYCSDIPMVWECNDTFAKQLSSPALPQAEHRDEDSSAIELLPRCTLQRRHSTGGVFDSSDPNCPTSTRDFWQLYEQDIRSPSSLQALSRAQGFERRRIVRFAPHVTVFVFSRQVGQVSDLISQQCFQPRTPLLESLEATPRRRNADSSNRNRLSEARFRPIHSMNAFANASLPTRRCESADNAQLQLPQAPFDFSTLNCIAHEESPPSIPRRILSKSSKERLPRLPQRKPSFSAAEPNGEAVTCSQDPDQSDSSACSVSSVDSISMTDYYAGETASEDEDDDDDVTSFADDNEEYISCDECDSLITDDDDDDDSVSCSSKKHLLNYGTMTSLSKARDCRDEEDRRERAMMWYHRWAAPTYPVMRRLVQNTSGLDISLEDVDLLPWSNTGEARR